ncbi:DUF418 domain-containing protein [Sulfitobacter sp. M57]|uniref:DUF418 domain-containing protein n=1 Tax=unclassified Sulfitobacter TaxID=196795 RepID=UPI0023E2E490|nr:MULTISPECIES: DUF418 domain-containing protein [unclassified Sulfitobacter]MDF3415111.1 DUF418 domain-containing protein [Sulfitobacter sp. KE5]MDF3422592.1 DUF418 domain-containing protein [Sulfitobacter sp. KE43]MDF3433657.1 DUF418 domain-containing protein [Sulfitobacter sp. KE42]MDF3459297.1 DUF418 domain-containing protein [Sulfitobacter sp. S74]MDF3463196.1 DUF418 domain-containing protein [Sulfitobacter sp. Ks18]
MNASQSSGARLEGLDLARYVAFVGMVIVNFKIAMGAEDQTGLLNNLTTALEGRAAATFVVLAGIGLGLAGRKGLDQTISVTVKRAIFLLLLGLLNMTIFDADILHYYAFYFLFGVLLLPLANGALFTVLIGLNIVFTLMILGLDYDAGWNWDDYTYSGFWTPVGFVRNLFFNGWHPVIPWLGFLVFGIILSRISLAQRATQATLVLGGIVTFAGAGLISGALGAQLGQIDPELAELVTTEPVPPMPLYMLAGLGAASIVVGICLMVSDHLKTLGLLQLIVPAGRQTLTLYIAHILIGMGTLEALGMLEGQSVANAVVASVLFCLVATLYALVWARWFKRGPIEAAMRKLAG